MVERAQKVLNFGDLRLRFQKYILTLTHTINIIRSNIIIVRTQSTHDSVITAAIAAKYVLLLLLLLSEKQIVM